MTKNKKGFLSARVDQATLDWLRKSAEDNGRNLGVEIEWLIRELRDLRRLESNDRQSRL
jgi:hypothetical protein